MDDRPTKLAKVAALRGRLPHISQSAFVAMLAAAQEPELPCVTRRQDVRDARSAIAQRQTPYGRVHQQLPLPRVGGGVVLLEVQSPWAMLSEMCSVSPCLCLLIRQTLQRTGMPTPDRPWRAVLYSDEVDPGDPLLGKHGREFQACYWSILDLGAAALSHEELWWTVCTPRSRIVAGVLGGMSGVMAAIIRHMFCGTHTPSVAGLHLEMNDGGPPVRLFVRFGMMTGDEAALQAINCTRGASGEMPCMFCCNVKSKRSADAPHDKSGYFVSPTETDLTKLRLHTDESVAAIAHGLQTKFSVQNPSAFKQTQKQIGFSYSLGSILLCPVLATIYKPISATVYDWLHCLLIDGVLAITMGETMAALREYRLLYSDIADFVGKWRWPARISKRSASGQDCRSWTTPTPTHRRRNVTVVRRI